jgi:hypothetical protein
MRRFTEESEAPDYLEWRRQNPLGFVLNINTWSTTAPSTTNIIHDAGGCSSLDQSRTENRDRHVTKDHPKLCSTDTQELVNEMKSKNLSNKYCGLCMKKRGYQ